MISVPIGRLEELRQLAVNNGFQVAILKAPVMACFSTPKELAASSGLESVGAHAVIASAATTSARKPIRYDII
jgi:hypothetical protein